MAKDCKAVFSFLWLLALVLLMHISLTDANSDNLGREFAVVFMRNEVEEVTETPVELFITTPSTIPVQVRVTTPKFTEQGIDITRTVVSGQVEKIELTHLIRLTWTGIEQKVVMITADSDIVVYGLNKQPYSTDGFLAYPTDSIGYHYYTVSYSPTNSNTEFAIAAFIDDTVVSMKFPKRQLGIPIRVEYEGKRYTDGDWLNITLQAYESFQCVSYDKADLTATYVTSSKPVAVFSGNIRTWVGESESRDHLAIQLPPVEAFGKQFPIVPVPGRTTGDVIRIIAPEPVTNIRIENSGVEYIEGGLVDNYREVVIPSDVHTTITADHPILVVQISQSQQDDAEPGDPTMLVVTATPQFASDYVFSTPQYSLGGSYTNYLMCVIKSTEIDGLMFDGRQFAVMNPEWKSLPGTDLVGTSVSIEEGAHAMRHSSPVAQFGGYVYGTANKESYSFQIGTRLAQINQPCIETPTVFGDGVDNDCDGLIDEELCTGANRDTDTDGDELLDEDCALIREIADGAPDSGGRQFIIYFMENTVEAPRYLPLEVYVTPVRAASVSVRIESPLWFEPAIWEETKISLGSVKKFNIPYTMREKGTTISSKTLFITSDADVVVYGVNKEVYSADAFLALPLDVLGRKYYAVTHWPNSDSSLCQIGMIGVYDGTKVDITFPSNSQRGIISVEYDGKTYTHGDTLTVALNRFSNLQLQSRGDLTGTLIESTQRVGVLSGNIRTSVGSGSSRDHLVAMLPTVESWGKLYCTVPIPGRTIGDYFYVMASEDNTLVTLTNREDIVLNAGEAEMLTIFSDEYVVISSNKSILVTQLSQSQRTSNEIGDPTMIILPSQEQWANAYTFSTTSNINNGVDNNNDLYDNYVVAVAPTDKTDGIIYDGQYLPPLFAAWNPIPDTPYSGTSFAISDGVHTLLHEDPTVTLSVLVYGNADKESYGFPAGMRSAKINAPCETTYPIHGDGIDNDCDGKIDEEICVGDNLLIDEDGDGVFNEDCAIVVEPPVRETTVVPPTTQTTTPVPEEVTPLIIVGPPGPPGPPGVQGSPGTQGAPGYNGIPGQPGANGVPGVDGEDGEVGATGATGIKGQQGATGTQGEKGLQGATGIQGPQGQTGTTGEKGFKGDQGLSVKGEKGLQGTVGATGVSGETGATGRVGQKGEQGASGDTGATGATGVKGEHGEKGEMGPGYLDINECDEGTDRCSDECVNTIGSYYCTCPEGYVLDDSQVTCVDDDECEHHNGGCTDTCTNTDGGHVCSCDTAGFHLSKDDRTCVDTDECATTSTHSCTEKQICVNSVGSYSCLNVTEEKLPEITTTPEPELQGCDLNNGGCSETCTTTETSFYCSCETDGYMLASNGQMCVDIDECQLGTSPCSPDTQQCLNTMGSYYCIDLPSATTEGNIQSVTNQQRNQLSDAASNLVNGNLILALIVWLCVITLILLPLLICVLVQNCRQTNIKEDYTNLLNNIHEKLDNQSQSDRILLPDNESTISSIPESRSYA